MVVYQSPELSLGCRASSCLSYISSYKYVIVVKSNSSSSSTVYIPAACTGSFWPGSIWVVFSSNSIVMFGNKGGENYTFGAHSQRPLLEAVVRSPRERPLTVWRKDGDGIWGFCDYLIIWRKEIGGGARRIGGRDWLLSQGFLRPTVPSNGSWMSLSSS